MAQRLEATLVTPGILLTSLWATGDYGLRLECLRWSSWWPWFPPKQLPRTFFTKWFVLVWPVREPSARGGLLKLASETVLSSRFSMSPRLSRQTSSNSIGSSKLRFEHWVTSNIICYLVGVRSFWTPSITHTKCAWHKRLKLLDANKRIFRYSIVAFFTESAERNSRQTKLSPNTWKMIKPFWLHQSAYCSTV